MKKLLLTGAGGFLGWNVCRMAGSRLDIFGTVFSHPVEIPGVSTLEIDLTDFTELKRAFSRIRPDAVIHTAAVSSPNFCQLNRAESYRINVEASINLAGLCADNSIPCVFTSSDLVFDGLNPPYGEEDPVSPVNVYGEHKALAEKGMVERYPLVTICRMPLMFGDPGPVAASFVQPMLKAMREGRELKLFVDEFRTPVSGRDAAKGLMMALAKVTGIIHLGGIERISRYDFGRLLADVFGFYDAKLSACRQRDISMPAQRSPDVSLNSEKAFALGFKPGRPKEELEALSIIAQTS
jgi:dTDP-4-dehydrorhamnose reductase